MDVIVTVQTPARAVKDATSTIPIVFAIAADPVGSGMVASLSRPGGNLTGFSIQVPDLAGKRIELLRELVPGLRRLAIIVNIANPGTMQEVTEAQSAAHKLGIEVHMLESGAPRISFRCSGASRIMCRRSM